jgi:threonine dehydrogenase-like Zn-dependent dehydrogenase
VDRAIDAVGVDANAPGNGPAKNSAEQHKGESEKIAPHRNPHDGNWEPGSAPSIVLDWIVQSVAKAGTVSIIGVYPPTVQHFPIGNAMNKNLRINMGNCNHRKYIPRLLELVRTNAIRPSRILTQDEALVSAVDAYKHFDKREAGWIKVMLEPTSVPAPAKAA